MNTKSYAPGDFKKGAITFLDVLGWKGIYRRDKMAMNTLIEIIEGSSIGINLNLELEERRVGIYKKFKGLTTDIIGLSDTIVIATF